jgi:subfamily B ATP-binding cassette protein HlyB/CyaB
MLAKDVENTFESTAVLFRTSSKSGRSPSPDSEGEPELTGAAAAKFGLRWFIPELLKHRPVWRDVLLASLAIQLAGRATPLFTQVVIDKVVVHHTRSTLIAVGITAPREVAVDREEVHKRRLLEARMRGRPSGSSP